MYHGVLYSACSDILLSSTWYASVTSVLRAIVRSAAYLLILLVNSFHRQFSNMFSVCLLTFFGLFTNSKKIFGVPGFPLEMENRVKSLHVLTY